MHHSVSDSKALTCLIDEDGSPSFNHYSLHQQLPRRSLDTLLSQNTNPCFDDNIESSSPPPVQTSPMWSFSPPHVHSHSHPHPPLVHHFISSLRRDGDIHCLVVSNRLVLTGSSSSCIRAWCPLTSCQKGYIQASLGEVRAMLAHGDMLFTSHKDHRIRVWQIDTGNANFASRKITTLPKSNPLRFLLSKTSAQPHKSTISCMAYNSTDGILYTGSWDKTVKAWRLSDRKCTDSFIAHSDNINDMAVNRDGYLFTCSSDGLVKMWGQVCGQTSHTLAMTLTFLSFPVYALALSEVWGSHEGVLYSGSSDGCINLWNRKFSGGYSHSGSFQAHRFAVHCLSVLEDMVISGSADSKIKVWKRVGPKLHHCVAVLDGHRGPVKCLTSCIAVESDKCFLVFSASLDHTFKVWRVNNVPEINTTHLHFDVDDTKQWENEHDTTSPVFSPFMG